MAKNTTLVVGAVSLLLVGTATYFVIKAVRKSNSSLPTGADGTATTTPPKKKATIIVGDLESGGIGTSTLPPLATPPIAGNDLGIGEMVGKVETWFGTLSNIFTPKSNIGLQTVTPTPVQNVDFRSQLQDSLNLGYGKTGANPLGINLHA
jgi:hypothetical protein